MTVEEKDLKPGSTGENSETDPSLSKEKTQEFVPPKDGSWVPRERLNNLTADMNAKFSSQQRRIDELTEKQNAPVEIPRSELLQKVDDGEISQAEADKVWEDQMVTKAAQSIKTVVEDTATANKLQSELAEYESKVPELSDKSSELYAKVAKEFQHFTNELGMPDTTSTTLAAVRSVVGPASKLKIVKVTKSDGENYEENSGGGDSGLKLNDDGTPKLTDRQKKHYGKCIDSGLYKDWDEVHKELKEFGS